MRKGTAFDWRIVWELGALVALSALIVTGGIYSLGPLILTRIPHQNIVPVEHFSISSSPSGTSETFPLSASPKKSQTAPPIPGPPQKNTVIKSSGPTPFSLQDSNPSSTQMVQISASARKAPSTLTKPPPMVKPFFPSIPSIEPNLPADPNVREVDEELIEEDNSPLEEGGRFSIDGIVLNPIGQPIPGIKVIASPYRLFDNDIGTVGSMGDNYALTNEVGVYEFGNLFGGEYWLRTEATPAYRSASKHVRAGIEQVILVLTPEGAQDVKGWVKDATSGNPLSGISITTVGQLVTSDDQGYYQISVPPQNDRTASTVIRFVHPDYHEKLVTVPKTVSRSDGQITLADILLKPIRGFSSVKGTVESLYGGALLEGVQVFLAPANGHSQLEALTNNEGLFQFPSVAWGTYTLIVAPTDGHKDFRQETLEVREVPVEDIQIRLEPSPVGVLRGQLVDPEGQPVRGFTLWLRSLSVRTFAGKPITSDQSGNFEAFDIPSGELQLSTQAEPHLQITGLHLQPGNPSPVQLVVDWGLQVLNGQIVDAEGLPIPGASISLIWMLEKGGIKSRGIRTTSADEIGVFRFTNVGTGPHTLNVSAQGYQRTLMEHHVGPGNSEVRVVISRKDF